MKIISLYQYSEKRKAIIINKAEFKEDPRKSQRPKQEIHVDRCNKS
jgi:hypothetical protein